MIKLIREGSKKYPWLLKIIMLVIGVTFIIGMGWFGYESSQQPNIVAVIGPYKVEAKEFRDAYNRAYDFYRNQLKQEVMDDAELKQTVMNSLVERNLWLVAADELDLAVHPDELRQAIMKRKEFQKDGVFDPEVYHRLLALNRMNATTFEGQLTKDLLRQKAQLIVQNVTTLNPAEMEEVDELAARAAAGMDDEQEITTTKTRIRLQLLVQKKQRALEAFQAAMRKTAEVEIREEFF